MGETKNRETTIFELDKKKFGAFVAELRVGCSFRFISSAENISEIYTGKRT